MGAPGPEEAEMAIAIASRALDGVEIPAAGTWEIDPAHTVVGFTVRHMMVAKVRGRFRSVAGTVVLGERTEDASVQVTIEAASIDTNERSRDAHLRSPDFLDAENHSTLEFRATGLRRTGDATFDLPGELTIRGVARPVTLSVDYLGITPDSDGATRAGFSASTEIEREDWGLTWNQALETGGVLVGKKVKIELDVSLVHRP